MSPSTGSKSRRPPSPSAKKALTKYREKRDFSRTPEPAGGSAARGKKTGLRFVVQKHAASRLHFDFRLELDGVMKSWAVPKGPSFDPGSKRLAMQVEDHPIEYNSFEGTIPQGEYGGGTVMIWDQGTYESDDDGEDALRRGLSEGKLAFTMHGERLKGSWALVQMKRGDGRQWLLIKHDDEFATKRDIAASETTSVVSGRTMDAIAKGKRV
jgi:bifunctional non-homologous end joining protein LigD